MVSLSPSAHDIQPEAEGPALRALARWVAGGGRSAAHLFALERFWASKLGVVSEELVFEPWEVIQSGAREPKLVAPVFQLNRIDPSSPSLAFLAAIPKVARFCEVEIDELGSFWFRTARISFQTKQQEVRERARMRERNVSGCLPGLNVYDAEVQALTKTVPVAMEDDWASLKNLLPANHLAEKARRATTLLLQTAFDRSVFGTESESVAFLNDEEAFVEAVFQALRNK